MVLRQHEHAAAEARAIMEAIRDFQTNPQLLDEARADTPAVLDRLRLSGTARHVVAATLAMSITGILADPGTPVFWSF